MKTLFCRQTVGLSLWAPLGGALKTVLMGLLLVFGLQVLGLSLNGSPFTALGRSALAAPTNSADPKAVLAAKKVPFEQEIQRIEAERLVFQRDLALREEQCLKRFFSAPCLEDIRAEYLREMRGFDLRREAALQAMRDIDARARADAREERIRARDDEAKERRGS